MIGGNKFSAIIIFHTEGIPLKVIISTFVDFLLNMLNIKFLLLDCCFFLSQVTCPSTPQTWPFCWSVWLWDSFSCLLSPPLPPSSLSDAAWAQKCRRRNLSSLSSGTNICFFSYVLYWKFTYHQCNWFLEHSFLFEYSFLLEHSSHLLNIDYFININLSLNIHYSLNIHFSLLNRLGEGVGKTFLWNEDVNFFHREKSENYAVGTLHHTYGWEGGRQSCFRHIQRNMTGWGGKWVKEEVLKELCSG